MQYNSILAVIALILLAGKGALGHAMLSSPRCRVTGNDAENGFTIGLGRSNSAMNPTDISICKGTSVQSPMVATYKSGSIVPIQYFITAGHKGWCRIEISLTGRYTDFTSIGFHPDCVAGAVGALGRPDLRQILVRMPRLSKARSNVVLRFYYQSDNGGFEIFDNCADIKLILDGSFDSISPPLTWNNHLRFANYVNNTADPKQSCNPYLGAQMSCLPFNKINWNVFSPLYFRKSCSTLTGSWIYEESKVSDCSDLSFYN